MAAFTDSQGRTFRYLRLSVTDRCNFRCVYCLPDGYQAPPESQAGPELSVDEIRRLSAGFAGLGFTKIRLTGGEPTVRRDIVEIAGAVASVPGIETVALTTNGYRLEQLALPLKQAGLGAVNVSLDSLDPARFEELTGSARHSAVLRGIERALGTGLTVKINAVLLKGFSEAELEPFLGWLRERPLSVRFIELMRTGKNRDLFEQRHLGAGELQFLLLRSGWRPVARGPESGPALELAHPGFRGSIGLIAPYSPEFCQSCNRLRVSSRGGLRLCLFGERDYPLRELLRRPDSAELLAARLRQLILRKPEAHRLQEGIYGNTWNLSAIGG